MTPRKFGGTMRQFRRNMMGEKLLRLLLLLVVVSYYEIVTLAALLIGVATLPMHRQKQTPCKAG